MAKIIEINSNPPPQSKASKRIQDQLDQEDLDEQKRKNKRVEKWDDLLYFLSYLIIALFVLILFGVIDLPLTANYLVGTGGIASIIIKIFLFVSKKNSS